jgi:hypothetical protein
MGINSRLDIDTFADIQKSPVGAKKSINTTVGGQDVKGLTRSGKAHIFKLGQHSRYDHRLGVKTPDSSNFCRDRFPVLQTALMTFSAVRCCRFMSGPCRGHRLNGGASALRINSAGQIANGIGLKWPGRRKGK